MVKRSAFLPKFDERFVNYGKDKISWIESLRYNGFFFAVMTGSFAIDVPHPRSSYAKKFYNVVEKQGAQEWEMNKLYEQFKKELYAQPDRSVVYFCDKSMNMQWKCLLNERLIGRVSGVIERTHEGG